MIVLRNRSYAIPENQDQPKGAAMIQAEQMRMQRQQIQSQQAQQTILAKQEMQKRRELMQQRKQESEEKMAEMRDSIRIRQQEQANGKADNTSLYKSRAKTVDPVPMK